ncbi:MAG: hypothetical protein IRZ16_10650 [Myxococcaceae bacterium]|nr:hypothetical protein [Myxococcaceae bacterium]
MSDLSQSVPNDVLEMWLAALVEDAGAKAAFVSTWDGEILASRGQSEQRIHPLPTPQQMLTGPKIFVSESGTERIVVAPAGPDLLLVGTFDIKTREDLILAAIAALTRPAR